MATVETSVDLSALPELPLDEAGPVFAEPWQAQAFAMTLELHRAGHFTWKEWCACLADVIAAARAGGDADRGDTYYHHWLAALEKLAADKELASASELAGRRQAWQRAARRTPHGQPIELDEH